MKLKIQTSMALDAICACDLIEDHGINNKTIQNEVLEILKTRTDGVFSKGALGYSTMCGIVSQYITDLSSATLDDLYNAFQNIESVDRIVRDKITNEFTASYVFPTLDILKNGWAEKYKNYITVLKSVGFEQLWRKKVLPEEQTYIDKLQSAFADKNIDGIITLISKMKGREINNVEVYVSLLSYPVSFTLHEGAFLDTINDGNDEYFKNGFLSMIAHELMHGFASGELAKTYQNFMSKTLYLRSTHDALIRDQHSGDEEEFVMAAEYYIMWRTGVMTKDSIVMKNLGRYGGCVPMALYIFEYMTREDDDIFDYNRWLTEHFNNNTFKPENVIPIIDNMMPQPDGYDSFFVVLFTVFQRCAFIIRDAQVSFDNNIQQEIEYLTGSCFVANEDKTVNFAKGSKSVGDHCRGRKTLHCDRLTVEAIEFDDKKYALDFTFPYSGSSIGAYVIEYCGECYKKPYILNLAYHKDAPIRAEVSFVCCNTRYLISSVCPDNIVDISTDADKSLTYRKYGTDIIEAVKKAENIVLLLNKQVQ